VFRATWATDACSQAFVPALTVEQLGTRNALILGLVFSAYMAPSVVGAPSKAASPLPPPNASRWASSWPGWPASSPLATSTLVLSIAASVIAGAGQGIAVSASIRGLLQGNSVAESNINLCCLVQDD